MTALDVHDRDYEVVIVGGGPVGLLLANLLGGYGIETLLLEQREGPITENRAVSLDDEALRVLAAAGLEHAIQAMTTEGFEVRYLGNDDQPLFTIRPDPHDQGFPIIALFVQPWLERSLLEGLQRFESVTVAFGHDVQWVRDDRDRVRVRARRVDGERVSATGRYVVACDGGRSPIRRACNIDLVGSTYRERWLVVDGMQAGDPPDHVFFHCRTDRPAVFVPRPGGHRRFEFALHDGEDEASAIEDEFVRTCLARYVDPDAFTVTRRVVYTFHARIAARMQRGRIFLAGDAAHLMPPFAGQGISTGFRDAHNLAWKLASALRRPDGEALLATYDRERRPFITDAIAMSQRLGQLVMTHNPAVAWVRDRAIRTALGRDSVRAWVEHARFKPRPHLRDGIVWTDRGGGPRTGRLCPRFAVRTATDTRSIDDVLGGEPCLLGIDLDPRHLPSAAVRTFEDHGISLLRIDTRRRTNGRLVDCDGMLGEASGRLWLVRPDRLVAADLAPSRADALARFVTDHFPRGARHEHTLAADQQRDLRPPRRALVHGR